nr:TIGR02117 family protein [Panacagrimonas sp.]
MKASYLLAALILGACSGRPDVVEPAPQPTPVRGHTVSVVSHGWHTGLIIPGPVLNRAIPELRARFGDPAHYEVGWGDKGFYQAQEITSGLTLRAMFQSEGAVLHIVALSDPPETYFRGEPLRSTCVSDQELKSLETFVANSFSRDRDGAVAGPRAGIYGDSAFYDGEGRYHLFNTCNKWTAKALRSAGLEIRPMLKLTAGSVMGYLERHRRSCATEPRDESR